MTPTPPPTVTILTNPYHLSHALPPAQVEFLLLCAVVCLVTGLLLCDNTTLRRIRRAVERLRAAPRSAEPAPRPAHYTQ